MNAPLFEPELTDRFIEAINQVPGLSTGALSRGLVSHQNVDGMLDLNVGGKQTLLLLDTKKTIFPGDVGNAVRLLKRVRDLKSPASSVLLVMLAETISPGAKALLQAEEIGYFDDSGSLYLPADGAHIFIDREPTKRQTKVIGSVFDGRRPEIIEALWEVGRDWSNVKSVADRITAAPSLVSATFQALEQHEWVEVQGQGPAKVRRLKNWNQLLDAWTDYERRREPLLFGKFYVPLKPQQIVSELDKACKDHDRPYEITGELAANLHSAAFTSVNVVRCRMLPDKTGEDILAQIKARPVGDGWNLAVIVGPWSDFSFKQEHGGLFYASPLRTYLDLQRIGGRGKDGAQLLREQELAAL